MPEALFPSSSMDTPPSRKRGLPLEDHTPPTKKLKGLPEVPAQYSDAVRKKLAATSRTGQACDRCKERKMKCDTDPVACQPCRQKGLRCYTTDRVTGQPRERGQSDRAENELQYLKEKLDAYQKRYGLLQNEDSNEILCSKLVAGVPSPTAEDAFHIPSARYVGWPQPETSEPLHLGPVKGPLVDVLDGIIDVAGFECEMMEEYGQQKRNIFNLSRTSITNTLRGYQRIEDPKLPPKEEALRAATHFLVIMSQYVPILHRPSFTDLVRRFYDQPASVRTAELVQIVVVLAIISHQTAVRNHFNSAEKLEDSHRFFHYGLGFYREILHDRSLASMQAMALIVIHFRNLPKPGLSWTYCHEILVRAIELEYHRDPDTISLPPGEDDILSKELRKRVFHSILGICVTTGCRVGLPAPWQFQHMDLPLPRALKDTELSKDGIASELSGYCEFWPCLQLAKLLPLLTELHNHIITVRRPPAAYLATVENLNTKILAWRQDWEDSIRSEPKQVNLSVATLLVETWAAEYQLNLHHPVCCPVDDPDVTERHLDICHKAAKRLLQAFHTLSSKYKGVDLTWHSTAAYAMGFGITLYIYRKRKARVSVEQFEVMRNELNGWISLMAYADLVLRTSDLYEMPGQTLTSIIGTGNHLQRIFQPRVQAIENEYREFIQQEPTQPLKVQIPCPPHASSSNGKQYVKLELSPQSATTTIVPALESPNMLGPRKEVAPVPYLQTRRPTDPSQWPAPFQYLPRANASAGYPTFTQPTPQYQSVQTPLAPLLNDSGGLYATYPTPPQTQPQGDPMIPFSPGQYFDGPGSQTWPLIAMPPNQQQ